MNEPITFELDSGDRVRIAEWRVGRQSLVVPVGFYRHEDNTTFSYDVVVGVELAMLEREAGALFVRQQLFLDYLSDNALAVYTYSRDDEGDTFVIDRAVTLADLRERGRYAALGRLAGY